MREALDAPRSEVKRSEAAVAAEQEDLQAAVGAEWKTMASGHAQLRQAQHSALETRAARLLRHPALVELALGQQPELLEQKA